MFPLALTVLLAGSGAADAAGYYTSDVGVRAFSRGGAYVAGASDLLALWYNPAALTRLHDGLVTVDVAGVDQYVMFDRADYPGEGPLDENGDPTDLVNAPVTNQAGAFIIPHMGAAWGFGLPDTTFAIGFYPPYAPDYAYPQDGAQRYTLTDTLVIQTFTGLSAAHRLFDRLSIGAGVSWNYLKVEQELAVRIPQNPVDPNGIEDSRYDVRFGVDGEDPFAIAWNVGLLYEPPSNVFAVGAMLQGPTKFVAEGSMRADFTDNFFRTDDALGIIAADVVTDEHVTFEVSMPLIARAGVLVRPTPEVEIELASVYEGWSVIDQVVIKDVGLSVPLDAEHPIAQALGLESIEVTEDVVLPAGYKDTVSVRLGGEWRIADPVSVRLGGLFETTAIPLQSQGVSLMDGNKWGYGLGATWRPLTRLHADFGWFQSFIPERTITGSTLESITLNWQTGEIVPGRNVGDGVLKSRASLLGLGLSYAFGKDPASLGRLGHAPPSDG